MSLHNIKLCNKALSITYNTIATKFFTVCFISGAKILDYISVAVTVFILENKYYSFAFPFSPKRILRVGGDFCLPISNDRYHYRCRFYALDFHFYYRYRCGYVFRKL